MFSKFLHSTHEIKLSNSISDSFLKPLNFNALCTFYFYFSVCHSLCRLCPVEECSVLWQQAGLSYPSRTDLFAPPFTREINPWWLRLPTGLCYAACYIARHSLLCQALGGGCIGDNARPACKCRSCQSVCHISIFYSTRHNPVSLPRDNMGHSALVLSGDF